MKEKMILQFLGTGSATPVVKRFPASQVLTYRQKSFLIDCGEGAQIQVRRNKISFERLHAVFISHLHGDHCFGLPGLLSSMNLLGRKKDFHVFAHASFEPMLDHIKDFFLSGIGYSIIFHAIDPTVHECIYEDKGMLVYSLPLKHRVPTCGFLFKEKEKELNIRGDMIKLFNIPIKEIKNIKAGADFLTPEGKCIPNVKLTLAPQPARSYAYCSDTAYLPELYKQVAEVDVLYHEATFSLQDHGLAELTQHSTTVEAAKVALEAGAKRLYIGHFSARYTNDDRLLEEARAIFAETHLAKDNLLIEI